MTYRAWRALGCMRGVHFVLTSASMPNHSESTHDRTRENDAIHPKIVIVRETFCGRLIDSLLCLSRGIGLIVGDIQLEAPPPTGSNFDHLCTLSTDPDHSVSTIREPGKACAITRVKYRWVINSRSRVGSSTVIHCSNARTNRNLCHLRDPGGVSVSATYYAYRLSLSVHLSTRYCSELGGKATVGPPVGAPWGSMSLSIHHVGARDAVPGFPNT